MKNAATTMDAAAALAPWNWMADLGRLQLDMALQGGQALFGNLDAAGRLWQDMALAGLQMQSMLLAGCYGKWVDPQALLAGATVLE